MGESTVGVLSATDRKQLCKITEGRFEMLREQLGARWSEIDVAVREQVMQEHESDLKKVRKQLRLNDEKSDKLDEEHARKEKEIAREREDIIAFASDLGLSVSDKYQNRNTVTPKNVDKAVKQRVGSYLLQYQDARRSLRSQELGVLEEISVAGLKSDEAKDFLGKIPDIDKLLPSVSEIPELQA